jgi:hypothetical protein
MRVLIKQADISFTNGTRIITVSNNDVFTAEDVRTVINETQKKVLVSSMQKDNIIDVTSNEITFANTLPVLATGDKLTIEIDYIITTTKRHLFDNPYDYMGIAPTRSLESDAVWKIVRIEIAGDGSVVEIKTLNNVKWSDVLTLIF